MLRERLAHWVHSPVLQRLILLGCVVLGGIACAAPRAQLAKRQAPLLPEVTHLTLRGNVTFGSRQLRRMMATQPRPFWPPWKRGELYNPPDLQADLRRLKKFYFDRGFLDTTVQLGAVQADPEARAVRLEILINEGPPTLVQLVSLVEETVPAELKPVATLVAALPLRPGMRLTKAAFTQSQDLLRSRLRNAGYARGRVVPHTEVDTQAHMATITWRMQAGARTAFGPITITGAKQVKTKAIRRQLTVHEGELSNDAAITESADAVYGLGMFQAVTPHKRNLEADDEKPLRLDFEVRERKPRTVRVGIGFSSIEQFRAQVGWRHRNLFGGAESLRLRGKVSSILQEVNAELHFPYFLARRTTLTQTLFLRREQELKTDAFGLTEALVNTLEAQPAFDLLSVDSQTRVGHAFTARLQGAAALELSLNDFRNVDRQALDEADLMSAEDYFFFLQRLEAQFDTSDSRFDPTRGIVLRGRLEHTSTLLLSDVSFVKWVLEARHYRRLGSGPPPAPFGGPPLNRGIGRVPRNFWERMILALRVRLGSIMPYGRSQDVPLNRRFFAGGPGSVRGFALNRLGPLDANDDPIGGHSLIAASIELRFPLFAAVSGVVFVDFGNVFRETLSYRLEALRYAVGPGLRYQTPIGPLRFDVGVVADRRSGEDFGRVEFSIGQAF